MREKLKTEVVYKHEWPLCEKCEERQSTHLCGNIYLCCVCYVNEGNPPADWHSLCMKTYEQT